MGEDRFTSPFDLFNWFSKTEVVGDVVNYSTGPIWDFVLSVMWIFGVIGVIAGVYFVYKTFQIDAEHHHHEREEIEHRKQKQSKPRTHAAWESVINNLYGPSEAYWRLSIMDADSLLDAMLIDLGLSGPSVGDKLKQIDGGRMRTLNEAWEAHKIRNRIAHDGINFSISQREAQRVVYLYEQAFREFGYI
jgi:hypothetical protein